MKLSKEKWMLTSMLLLVLIAVIIFVSLFYMSRPKLVLSDMISYFPEAVDVSTAEEGELLTSITNIQEIEQFFVVLSIGNWKHEAEGDVPSGGKCEPSYSMKVNDYHIKLMCSDPNQGHITVIKNEAEYHYSLPAELYSNIEQHIEPYINNAA